MQDVRKRQPKAKRQMNGEQRCTDQTQIVNNNTCFFSGREQKVEKWRMGESQRCGCVFLFDQ